VSEIITGDCLDELEQLDENSVEAIVTDPPYGLAFMGRSWDDFEPKEYQEWCQKWAKKALKVLKPGGHMLAFSGNRTHHRLFTGVEDAGFEIRDTITWHYGSGFPKALDVSKAIDKQADAEREVVAENPSKRSDEAEARTGGKSQSGETVHAPITEPATEAAQKWDGFKTALKPATEYVVVARKPFDGTVAENIQEYETGALNIDGTRIETDGRPKREIEDTDANSEIYGTTIQETTGKATGETTEGRYPSNVVFDATEAERLDREVGATAGQGVGGQAQNSGDNIDNDIYGDGYIRSAVGHNDSGGPSRYFYTSKATRAERTLDGRIDNAHPTVKPGDLMEWLVTLVTAEGQIVLDPFAGSGTTCRAAKDKGRRFVGIERQAKWADVARVRCGLTPEDPAAVRGDEAQQGLESFGGDE